MRLPVQPSRFVYLEGLLAFTDKKNNAASSPSNKSAMQVCKSIHLRRTKKGLQAHVSEINPPKVGGVGQNRTIPMSFGLVKPLPFLSSAPHHKLQPGEHSLGKRSLRSSGSPGWVC